MPITLEKTGECLDAINLTTIKHMNNYKQTLRWQILYKHVFTNK
jgi:hypothetical protein